MEVAYVGERLTPSQCGRMDQAVAFGSRPVLMTYDGGEHAGAVRHLPPPRAAASSDDERRHVQVAMGS